jgi:hypothetical protein
LSPVGKEVVDPVGLTLIVQTIYEAFVVVTQIARSLVREMISEQLFTARDVSFYDQPSENAKSGKPKREKEKRLEWRYARRFGGSLTRLDSTCVVRRPSLRFGTDQPLGFVFCKYTGVRCL